MPSINLVLGPEPVWPDLADREVIHYLEPIGMSALPGGMESGATSVVIRLDLPDGRVVMAETSLALLLGAARAIAARYPSPPGTGENAP
jgi:hypothetical protein